MKKLLLLLSVVIAGCGGGGGSGTNTVSNTPTVSNIQSVNQLQANTVSTPLCSVASSVAPANFTGYYAIPSPTQRLNNSIQRSVGFKDYGGQNNCAYSVALDRLQALGVDRVWIYNYGLWDDINKDVWTITDWQISKSTMTYIVTEAKKRNIKVFLAFQFTGYDSYGNMLPFGNDIPKPLLTKMLNSHKKMIVDYAAFGETIGLSGLSVDWNAFHIPNMSEHSELWITSMASIASAIRTKFSGTLTYGEIGWPWFADDKRIFDAVDELHISIIPHITATENANISVSLLKEKYSEKIKEYAGYLNNTTKPVTFEITIQSIANYFYTGGAEDGFCISTINGSPIDWNSPNCMQKDYGTDFSMQAMGVEAALEAVASQTSFVTKSVNFHTSYWLTDTLTPGEEGFPNLSQSIRGKPAEKIVKYWFTRG